MCSCTHPLSIRFEGESHFAPLVSPIENTSSASLVSLPNKSTSILTNSQTSQQPVAKFQEKIGALTSHFQAVKEQNQILVEKLAATCHQQQQSLTCRSLEVDSLKERVKDLKEQLMALRERKLEKIKESSQKILEARKDNKQTIESAIQSNQTQVNEIRKRLALEQISKQVPISNKMSVVLDIFEELQQKCYQRLSESGKENLSIHAEYNLARGYLVINDIGLGSFRVDAAKCRRYFVGRSNSQVILNQYTIILNLLSKLKTQCKSVLIK